MVRARFADKSTLGTIYVYGTRLNTFLKILWIREICFPVVRRLFEAADPSAESPGRLFPDPFDHAGVIVTVARIVV